jgi:hypothetical protein
MKLISSVTSAMVRLGGEVTETNGAAKQVATLFSSAFDAVNLYAAVPYQVVATKVMKTVAEVIGSLEFVGNLNMIVTGKAATSSPIIVEGTRLPNPITFGAASCLLVSQLGGAINFWNKMDALDIGKLAASVGSLPYFGSVLELGIRELPVLRNTFGITGLVLNLCEQFRLVTAEGWNMQIAIRIVQFAGKLAFVLFIDSQIVFVRFLAHIANATSATSALAAILVR